MDMNIGNKTAVNFDRFVTVLRTLSCDVNHNRTATVSACNGIPGNNGCSRPTAKAQQWTQYIAHVSNDPEHGLEPSQTLRHVQQDNNRQPRRPHFCCILRENNHMEDMMIESLPFEGI